MKRILFLILIIISSCSENKNSESPAINNDCCGPNPYQSSNINNLDQTPGEIIIEPYFTPNGDAFNDFWFINNLDLYNPISLQIFNSNDQSVYLQTDFSQYIGWSGDNLTEGIYRYKLIIENENTYLQQGYFCLIINADNNLSTGDCNHSGGDPIIP